MHFLTNVTLEAEGDDVRSRSYVHAVITVIGKDSPVHVFCWYEDLIVDTADGWRMAKRVLVPDYSERDNVIST
jgi:hypothetical protein